MIAPVYFTLETRKRGIDVQGPGWHPEKLGLSVAVTLTGNGVRSFQERDLPKLMRVLRAADLVIGYNLVEFDFNVLSGYPDFALECIKYLDMLHEIEEAAGYRVGLHDLEMASSLESEGHSFLDSVQLWKEGRIDELKFASETRVRRIRAVHEYGMRKGEVVYFKNEQRDRQPLPVKW